MKTTPRGPLPINTPCSQAPTSPRGIYPCLGLSTVLTVLTMILSLSGFVGSALSADPSQASEKKTNESSKNPTQKASTNAVQSLFDGKTLKGWKITDFAGKGEVKVEDGKLILGTGIMTGVTWTNDLPRMDYEISLEAMRVDGSDFFCALTFPYGKEPCSFIIGGWGGGVVGLSSVDNEDAAHNETTQYLNFQNGKWFKVRLKVTKERIEAWIDKDRVVNLETAGKAISIRMEVELSKPLGIATWSTTGAIRNIELRKF